MTNGETSGRYDDEKRTQSVEDSKAGQAGQNVEDPIVTEDIEGEKEQDAGS